MRSDVAGFLAKYAIGRRLLDWRQHQRTQVYLLSYPKCGRTWLRLMIGKALDEQFELGSSDPMDLAAMSARVPTIPRIRVRHEFKWYQPGAVESSKEQYRDKTVVFLVRDPRDVVVSMYFNATKRQHLNDEAQRRYMFEGDLGLYLRHPVGSLDQIIDYYNVWAESREVPRRFCLVRYEELHADAGAALRAVLGAMGITVSEAAVDRAVAFGRFDNMRKLESADAFGSHRLRPADAADGESFKTRQGKVGGHVKYLADEDLAYVNRTIEERLSPFYASYR